MGKTTLFKLVLGSLAPTDGAVVKGKNVKLGYMEQHACSDPDKTVYDEMISVFEPLIQAEARLNRINDLLSGGADDTDALIEEQALLREQFERDGGLTYRSRAYAALVGLGFPKETHGLTCDKLSGGQRSKISLGKLLLSDADLILLDEPTNHLDIDSVEWLEDYLTDYKGSALIISHDRYFLDKVTTKTIVIENRKIKLYNGNYSMSVTQREKDKEILRRHYQNTMNEVHRIEKIIEQQKQWNRERNIRTAEHKQKSIDRLLENIEIPDKDEDTVRFDFSAVDDSGNDVYSMEGISKGFNGKLLFDNVDLLIKKYERVFLLGPNGCGKTTLFRIIVGQYLPDTGFKKAGVNVRIGYFDQSLEGLDLNKTVIDEVWDRHRNMTQTEVRNALAAFLFRGDDVFQPVSVLSGGEKARLAILKLMLGNYNFLLLDEPTNHLDIDSREALEKALLNYNGTMFVISHDRYFINKLSTRILRMTSSGLENFGNDYDAYVARMKDRPVIRTGGSDERGKKTNVYMQRKALESEKRKAETRDKKIEEEIAELEKECEEIEAMLSSPETASDFEAVVSLSQKLADNNERIEKLMEEWEANHERLSEIDEELLLCKL